MKSLKFVTKREFEALQEAGLICIERDEKRKVVSKNFNITSRKKKAPRGKHYVNETKKIMEFLQNLEK